MAQKKTYNYTPNKSWCGGTGPNRENFNGSKKDFNSYLKAWDEFNKKIEKLSGLKVTGYDPGINLTDTKDGKWTTIQIPCWFAQQLIDKFQGLEQEIQSLKNIDCDDGPISPLCIRT